MNAIQTDENSFLNSPMVFEKVGPTILNCFSSTRAPLALTVITITFFHEIAMIIQALRSWELKVWSPKLNVLDILITSHQYFY